MNTNELIAVTVTYYPEPHLLRAQLEALPRDCLKIVVDNASAETARQSIRKLRESIPHVHCVENSENIGLAAALNQGVRLGKELRPNALCCLLLDQDSELQGDCVAELWKSMNALTQQGERVGCVGPLLVDAKTGLTHGFHQMTRWCWRRVYPALGDDAPIRCSNINGSGTFMPIDLFLQLKGLDESLFIDHVDTEWSFRLQAHGYTLWGIPKATFLHRMGETSLRFWLLGWRVWPDRSPQRHRYLFRNAVWLMRRPYIPNVWKFWAVVKLTLTMVVHGAFDSRRSIQLKNMLLGLKQGMSENGND